MSLTEKTDTGVVFAAGTLKKTLMRLKPITPRYNNNPALDMIHVAYGDGVAVLTVTNIDLTLSVSVPAPSMECGVILVPFAVLSKMVTANPKGTVCLSPVPAGVSISVDRSTVTVDTVPADEFPKTPTVDGVPFALNIDALADVLPAVSRDDYRPVLCGVYVNAGVYVATDSYRLYTVDTGDENTGAMLVPRKAVELITKKRAGVCPAVCDGKNLRVMLDGDAVLTVWLTDGEFPKYRTLIPAHRDVLLECGETFAGDVTALAKMSSDKKPTVRVEPVEVDRSAGVRLTVDGASTVCDGVLRGDVPAVGFNAVFLAGILDGFGNRTVYGADALKPVFVVDGNRMRLLMPVRLG